MTRPRSERNSGARSLYGVALALCLMALQLFAAMAAPAARRFGNGLDAAPSGLTLCAELDKDPGKAPSLQRHLHEDSFARTFARAYADFDDAAVFGRHAAPTGASAQLIRVYRIFTGAAPSAAGFASAWSSRAPPVFS